MHFNPLSRWLIQMLNGLGHSISSRSAPLITSYQLDFKPLISSLNAQQSRQLSTYVYPSSLYRYYLMANDMKGFAKVKLKSIHCSSLVFSALHIIVDNHQSGWSDTIALDKSMMVVPINFLSSCSWIWFSEGFAPQSSW